MGKYRDRISSDQVQKVKQMLAESSVVFRFCSVIDSDISLREAMVAFLTNSRCQRERDLQELLPVMRKNKVPEDLIWAITCAASQDSIAKVLLSIASQGGPPRLKDSISDN